MNSETDTTASLSRKAIQTHIDDAVTTALEGLNLPDTKQSSHRVVRCLLRRAAHELLKAGCPANAPKVLATLGAAVVDVVKGLRKEGVLDVAHPTESALTVTVTDPSTAN